MLLIVILNQGGPYGDREEIRTSGLDRTSEVREEREFQGPGHALWASAE